MKHRRGQGVWLVLALAVVVGSLALLPAFSATQGKLETPQPGSFQSGIGLVRGWVCQAGRVEIEVVGRGTLPAVYGELRGDTQSACGGKADNGFSLIVNWNELGEGTHTIRALADNVEFGRAQVIVATLGQPFLRGAQGEFIVQPFPQSGSQTHIRWQESQQAFTLSDGGTPASGGSNPRSDAMLEDPQSGSFQSGIGVARGWVCNATRVEIELDGRITLPAAYGEAREDTQTACNDDGNNGFSLQINWNEVNPGSHTLRALADGVEIGRATFTVVTLGLGAFPKGLVGDFPVANFPQLGVQTQVQWQESQQNFVITGSRFPGIDASLCTTRTGQATDGSGGTAAVSVTNPCLLSGNMAVCRVQPKIVAAVLDERSDREVRSAANGAFFVCATKLTVQQGGQTFGSSDFRLVDFAGNDVCGEIALGSTLDLFLQVKAQSELNFNAPFNVLYNGQPVVDFPGTPVPGTPTVVISATELKFSANTSSALRAAVAAGDDTRAATLPCQEQSFTTTNSGGGTLLGGMTLIADGSGRNVFSIISGGEINLGAGASLTTVVRFCPISTEPVAGALRISTNGGAKVVVLQAAAQQSGGFNEKPPVVSASTTSLDFGTLLRTQTADRAFTVSNNGGGTLAGTADIEPGGPFSVIAGGTFTLQAGEEQSVTIRLAPASIGSVTGRVTLNTNGGTFVVLLGGTVSDSPPPNCDDQNRCTSDRVDPTSHACVHTPVSCAAGSACNPSNGACEPTSCDDGQLCTTDSVDPSTHTCVHTPASCVAGSACNPSNGFCEPTNCDDQNPCTNDSVDPSTHTCVHTLKVCPAGQSCNVTSGACEAPPLPSCDDGNPCTEDSRYYYDPYVCFHYPLVCDGGQACNPSNGACEPINCDDGNLCTNDSVDPTNHTCVHTPKCQFCNSDGSCSPG